MARVAYCSECGADVPVGDKTCGFFGKTYYAMICNCGHQWALPVGQEAKLEQHDTDPITQPCVSPKAVEPLPKYCWRCGREGEPSQYAERLWCRDCGTWLDEYRPEVA